MVGGKQGMDIKGNGETCKEGGLIPVSQMAKGYGINTELQNLLRKLCQMKKNLFYLFVSKNLIN